MSYAQFEVGPWSYDVEVVADDGTILEEVWWFNFMMEQTGEGWTATMTTCIDDDGTEWPRGMTLSLLGDDQVAWVELEQAEGYIVSEEDCKG